MAGSKYWITEYNQEFISELTGVPLEKIQKKYAAARRKGLVCTMKIPNPKQRSVNENRKG